MNFDKPIRRHFLHKSLALILLLTFALTAWPMAALTIRAEEQEEEKPELQKVTVILDYILNTNHAGLLMAQDRGYYEEEGLDVEILEPAEGVTTTLIATGKGDIGVSYQEDIVYARSAEDPLPLVALAAIIQNNTSGFASAKAKGIERPRDFEGKTYSGWGSPAEEAILRAVMKADGADPDTLNYTISDFTDYHVLEGDDIDLIWVYEAWDKIMAERAGVALNYIPCAEYDERLNYYTPILFTNEDTIENDPEMLRAFMRATSRGYLAAIQEPDVAAELVHEHTELYELDMLKESMDFLAGEYGRGAERWGEMDVKVWDNYSEFMLESGLIDKVPASEDCFTNDFLPEAEESADAEAEDEAAADGEADTEAEAEATEDAGEDA